MNATSTIAEGYRDCRRVVNRSRSNLGKAFWLLPKDQHQAMDALYAFARQADDLADQAAPVCQKRDSLAAYRSQLDGALRGQIATPLFAALADSIQRFHIPAQPLHDLLDGVELDLVPRQPETWAELETYCEKVASSVGLACLAIWRADQPELYTSARSCGIALQLTNILRDLAEDARLGRCYLPRDLLREHGLESIPQSQWSTHPGCLPLLHAVCDRARQEYAHAEQMLPALPPAPRRLCRLMQQTYRALLDRIAHNPQEVLRRRISLRWWSKLIIALRAVFS